MPRLPRPAVTASSFVTVYRRLPNDTDFTVWQAAGWTGLNFACIGGADRYHTAEDDLAHLDLRTVQHHGENALALARLLASEAVGDLASDQDAVFCDWLGMTVICWPESWGVPLAVLAVVLLLLADRQALHSAGTWRGLAREALGSGAVIGLAMLWGWGVSWLYARCGGPSYPDAWINGLMAGAYWLGAGVLIRIGGFWLRRGITDEVAWLGPWLVWNITDVLTGWLVPGFGYVFLLPCLWAGCVAWLPGDRRWRASAALLGAATVVLPTLHLLTIGLGPRTGVVLCPAFAFALLPLMSLEWRRGTRS